MENKDKQLKMESLPDFVKQFIKKTKDLPPDIVAEMVWELVNERWTAGYNRGKYEPYYDIL